MENKYYDFLLLLTDDETLSRNLSIQLSELDEDPIAFYSKSENKKLNQRGMPNDAAKYHFFDVLGEQKFIYETDWKADIDELNYAIKWMSKDRITTDLLSEEDEEFCEGMFELIDNAQPILRKLGFALFEFPHDGDAHAITLITLDKQEELQAEMPF